MDFTSYLGKFQKSAELLDKKMLAGKQIEVAVGIYKDSVFLKLFKPTWYNKFEDPLTSDSKIFFSVWINDSIIKEQKLFYNIHALKLRQLEGYSITSRDFAETFRKQFKNFEHQWPNVSLKFGPQTLMEGWINTDVKSLENKILKLSNQFLKIEYIVDDVLEKFSQL